DWVEEAAAAGAGDEFKISSPSLRAVGLGFRAYFDWVISELFFLNLYNQTIFYLPVEKDNILTPGVENEYEDGYSLTFEIEPHFNYALSDSLSVSAGVPLTWTMRPETVIDGVGNDEPFSLLTVSPSVSAFVMTTLPIELEVGYTLPLAGRNAPAAGTLVVQLKTFLRF
ncbi:MAG TPA: hypothetical protein VLH39_05695, partial [Magnetospirillaceae bacterium]|nr:hypothetical protein [Magnetospirillaceae bacterium]